ncbi:aldehyde dehydrogenase family protein [Pallidibacillus pasinlerensis]|uniref:Aldehyde dehydrogenase n=1 Tax=Pallidibacillus pasinlerensis TaxID=2703818 RepID=A0ABX0AAW4_9BACI|nr:aldehyde dehydrogenase family protein [Pallidibacillus pasinlerensis]NCU18565.1 aldehyde dehydrogenase family protein [Pallidibacillus pasinlerensis]
MGVLKVINPATGEHLEDIEETSLQEVDAYYSRAREAFKKWSQLSIDERLRYLKNLKHTILEQMDELVQTIVQDNGKVPTEALIADVMPSLDGIDYVVKYAKRELSPKKVNTPLLLIGKKSYIEYMPRGVVLIISPWNYPFQLSIVPMISALAGGNTVILKPSEVTPYVGKYIEKLFQKAGFPEHVVQFAHGGKEVGAAFTNGNPDYIFFTGSVRTGRIIQKVAAEKLIPTTLELGGKDPFIVFADANLERAAKGAVWAAFTNTGQVCMSAERVYVEKTVYEKFLQLVKEETENLVLGTARDSDVGSMTYPVQKEIVKKQVLDALQHGAKLETGIHPDEWDDSMFVRPMILSNVKHEMDICREEFFGPVMPIVPFETEEEVIKFANDSKYGLNSSVWSSDLQKARRVASQLITGAVNINEVAVSVANHHLPFGGVKESGIGRYHGSAGLTIFCHEKAIVVDSGKLKTEIQWYPYKGKYEDFLELFQSYFSPRRNWIRFVRCFLRLLRK